METCHEYIQKPNKFCNLDRTVVAAAEKIAVGRLLRPRARSVGDDGCGGTGSRGNDRVGEKAAAIQRSNLEGLVKNLRLH